MVTYIGDMLHSIISSPLSKCHSLLTLFQCGVVHALVIQSTCVELINYKMEQSKYTTPIKDLISLDSLMLHFGQTSTTGFLLEAASRVPAPVYFEQSTRLLSAKLKKKKGKKKIINLNLILTLPCKFKAFVLHLFIN